MRHHCPVLAVLLIGTVSALSSVSCSRTEPRILYAHMELVYFAGTKEPLERFSLFILPDDDDGIENLAELHVYHDREGLHWQLGPDEWTAYRQEEKTWIGSRNIAMFEDAVLPRGQYRIVLFNKAGEKSEKLSTFDAPELPRYPFPSLKIANGYYTIASKYPQNTLICYDALGNFVRNQKLSAWEGTISDLGLSATIRSVSLWADDPEYHTSAVSAVVSLH
ncbi:hypothetical protein ACYULU_11415 [Breznakiellaceae bacterium SP9]